MHKMSQEQRTVLDYIRADSNVIVDACAGSGKSTTILSIAKELTGKTIRQFTYNSMLRHEIKEKVRELGLPNLEVHTYHSFAVKYYTSEAHTDTGIRHITRMGTEPRKPIPLVDIVVVDESQDMTMLYFELIVKMANDMCSLANPLVKGEPHKFQLLILGDYMQGLYEFKGADIRFLTKASDIWSGLPYLVSPVFEKCVLKTSYRVTNQMAKFVNRDMLGEDRLVACREGMPVVYIRRPRYQIEKIVAYQIQRLLSEGESPSDIFVLGGSVKGANSNIRHMENVLTDAGIPCHVPMMETDVMDERVIDGKVVFSTFHTVKGRQRKYVFVVGFDQGYFYTARNIPKDVCPNTLYVACTRATHGLYLLENDSSRPLEFLKRGQPDMKQSDYIDFKGIPQSIFHDNVQEDEGKGIVIIPTYHVTPTELIKFVPESVIEYVTPILDKIFIREVEPLEEMEFDIPRMVQTSLGLFEEVSDLNGIALPAMYYDAIQGTTHDGEDILRSIIRTCVQDLKGNSHPYLKRIAAELPEKCETPGDYLFLANVCVAMQEKLYSKLKQIGRDEYTWLSVEMRDKCVSRLNEHLGHEFNKGGEKKVEVEKLLIHYVHETEHNLIDAALYPYFSYEKRFRFCARADLVSDTTLWELKCTSKITFEHRMQVVIYTWLWRTLHPESPRKTQIFNIRTGEKLRLESSDEDLTRIMVSLLRGKYEESVILNDEEFVNQCINIITPF
jgi:hypothetical protein